MNTSKNIGFSGSKLTKPSCLKHANTMMSDQNAEFVDNQSSDCLDACYAAALTWCAARLYDGLLFQAHRSCCYSCSQECRYAMRMLHHSLDTHADPAAALLCYLLSNRMADAKSPAATWSAAREHFCSQRCVGVTPGVGATN